MDFVQSKSMGCGSAADLLLGVGGMGDEQAEDGAEGGRVTECIGVAAEFLGVVT